MNETARGVSVIIPAYNAAAYLGEALASLGLQKHPRLEVLIVDDGSQEDLAPIVRASPRPARLIRRAHAGVAKARNAGLAATSHPLIVFLDADDLLLPEGLDRLLAASLANPALPIVHGRMRKFRDVPGQNGNAGHRELAEAIHGIILGSMLLCRVDVERIGGFREDVPVGEDSDLLVRLEQAGVRRLPIEDEVLLLRRGHAGLSRRAGTAAHEHAWLKNARDRARGNRARG